MSKMHSTPSDSNLLAIFTLELIFNQFLKRLKSYKNALWSYSGLSSEKKIQRIMKMYIKMESLTTIT